MNTKVHINLSQGIIEAEGSEEFVTKVYEDFKAQASNPKYSVQQPESLGSNQPVKLISASGDSSCDEIPALKEVIMKDLPKTEGEWVLIYTLYASKNGDERFSEDDIKNYYEISKRKTANRAANLSNNIKGLLSKGYIKVHNDEEYIITSEGVEHCNKIFNGTSQSKSSGKAKKVDGKVTKSSTSGKESFEMVPSFANGEEGKKFASEIKNFEIPESHQKKVTLFLVVMKKIGLANIGINHIFTCYRLLKEKTPGNLRQTILDAKSKNVWVVNDSWDDLQPHFKGEEMVEHMLEKKKLTDKGIE